MSESEKRESCCQSWNMVSFYPSSFSSTSNDMLAKSLEKVEYCACTLHDGKGQEQQEFVRLQGQSQGLAGHDRIPIQDVFKVINCVMAKNMDNYIHCIGYMEQARKSGIAIIRAQMGSMHWSNFLKSLPYCLPELVSHPGTQHKQCTPPRSSGKKPGLLDKTLP